MPTSEENEATSPLSIREKLCYGLGDFSNGLAVSSVGIWLLIYLTDVAGLGAFLAGVAVMIGRAWDAVTDPIMGWITDHTKSRWGKRRPYLLFGAIPYAIAFFSLWVIPEFDHEHSTFIYITLALIVFNTSLTVVFVPYTSLTAGLTEDYNERTSLTGFRMTSSQTAFLVGAVLPSALVLWVTSDACREMLSNTGMWSAFGSWAGTPRAGYLIMAAIFAVIIVASIWITFFGTRERNFHRGGEDVTSTHTPLTYATSILDQLQGNRPFRVSVMILLLSNCAATFVAVNLPYYLQYVLLLKDKQTSIMFALFVMAIISVPAWVLITKRFGKSETYQVAMILYVFVLCALPLIQPQSLTQAYIIAVIGGFFHAAALMIPWAIVPDVVEFDELKTGQRREGLFYGGTTFSYKMATAIAVFVSGSALEWVGYTPNVEQVPQALLGIKALIGPAPAILLLFAARLASKYPLTRERHLQIIEELKAKKNS